VGTDQIEKNMSKKWLDWIGMERFCKEEGSKKFSETVPAGGVKKGGRVEYPRRKEEG
jgi:hypothetical protein